MVNSPRDLCPLGGQGLKNQRVKHHQPEEQMSTPPQFGNPVVTQAAEPLSPRPLTTAVGVGKNGSADKASRTGALADTESSTNPRY